MLDFSSEEHGSEAMAALSDGAGPMRPLARVCQADSAQTSFPSTVLCEPASGGPGGGELATLLQMFSND